ncbi:hypothetical protein [Tenacibaculum sp. L6]|uniref:hypothetical protein n=1 Tax=Tenacibaculum sp. L6 TaxID=2992764 RepID=UPI00237B9CE6|nr:hypothetical protein [Tenacibaculum sp. L6]MDE0536042.1 hypothetical protein [Tenacibaculum sp. L6]
MELNETKLHDLLGKIVTEIGAAANEPLVTIGDKLELYKSLSESDALSSSELADKTNTSERYVREWLAAHAASGYVEYDATNNNFYMTPEQTAVFGNNKSPVFMQFLQYTMTNQKLKRLLKLEKEFLGETTTPLFAILKTIISVVFR